MTNDHLSLQDLNRQYARDAQFGTLLLWCEHNEAETAAETAAYAHAREAAWEDNDSDYDPPKHLGCAVVLGILGGIALVGAVAVWALRLPVSAQADLGAIGLLVVPTLIVVGVLAWGKRR